MRMRHLMATVLLVGGCGSPVAALFTAGEVEGQKLDTPSLSVSFRPGLPLFAAAASAPAAFSRLRGAAARLDREKLSLGEATTVLEGELLHSGLLLPLPAGTLTIRTITPEAAMDAPAGVPARTEVGYEAHAPSRRLAEIIGAYGKHGDRRLLLLSTDGSFVLTLPSAPPCHGTFALRGDKLQLAPEGEGGAALVFSPVGSDAWQSSGGLLFDLLHSTEVSQKPHAERAGDLP